MILGALKQAFYGLIYITGLWRLFRHFNRHRIPIVMYHGICEEDIHVWTQIPLSKFERQIAYIHRNYRVISLDDALAILKKEKPAPFRPLVITFDDGFMSNKTLAYPVLRRYNLPATIFLTTAFINKTKRFNGLIWTDYIVGLFRTSPKTCIDLREQGLGIIKLGALKSRIRAAYRVSNALKRMSRDDEYRIIAVIAEKLGDNLGAGDYHIFKSLEWDDICRMHSEELIAFGAHTVHHEILSRLPYDEMVSEIVDSKLTIEKMLALPVRHFAYPNGTAADFNDAVKEVAARHFDCALSTIAGLNSPNFDRYQLKRIGVGNDTELWRLKLELSGVNDFVYRVGALVSEFYRRRKAQRAATLKQVIVREDDNY
jgi:peptidoglycan/xylan/chitin deacetylase (PgdA/CDA1 family)